MQYGPRITAIIRYLYVGQSLSTKRTAAALAGLLSTPVSEGTIAAMTTRAATGLAGLLDWVRANLAAEVVNFDETGWRVAGRPRWVHSASTGKYSLIFRHGRRGTKGMDAAHHSATRRGGDPDLGGHADGHTARPGPAPDRPPGRLRQLLLQRTEVLAVVGECQPWLTRRAKCWHR